VAQASQVMHATCVAIAGKGILITGPSGSGKSALALQMVVLGGVLVADDRTALTRHANRILAAPPPTIAGRIEARGIGILTMPFLRDIRVALVVDMGHLETARLPDPRTMMVLDMDLPCLHKVDAPYFPAALHAYIMGT